MFSGSICSGEQGQPVQKEACRASVHVRGRAPLTPLVPYSRLNILQAPTAQSICRLAASCKHEAFSRRRTEETPPRKHL